VKLDEEVFALIDLQPSSDADRPQYTGPGRRLRGIGYFVVRRIPSYAQLANYLVLQPVLSSTA
jgi:hypothetical protein